MKMRKIYKLTAMLLGSMILATSCIEETFPLNGTGTSDMINKSEFAANGLEAAMSAILITNNVYGWDVHGDFGYPSLMATYDRVIGEVFPVGTNQYRDQFQNYAYQMYIGPTGFCAYIWYHYYQFIKITNDLIKTCGKNENLKEQRGVAKTFRALYYLDLARLYDPLDAISTEVATYQSELANVAGLTVPIVDENTTERSAKNNPRLPREQMFQFIFNDLNDAENCLTDFVPNAKNIPSLAVIYGLKARAYLWLGGFKEQYDATEYPDVLTGEAAYRKAAYYARLAITESKCTPLTESEYCDPINGFNTINNAWLWGMIQSSETVLSNLHTWAAHMCCAAGWGYGSGALPGVRRASYERMSDTDFRKKLIVGPNTEYKDYKDVTNLTKSEWTTFGIDATGMLPYANLKFRTNGGEKTDSSTGNVVDIPLMRVEEMYFIEAEATAQYDAATGKTLIESFMTSYRDPKYSVQSLDLIDEIIFQKRVELWGEGLLLFDFKRLNMSLDNAYEGTNTPAGLDFHSYGRCPAWNFCIPTAETQQNRAIQGKNNPDPSMTLKPKNEIPN